MFKEIVSAAIIIGLLLNVAFVRHPDQNSYSIAFIIGLLIECPFLAVWWYLKTNERQQQVVEQEVEASEDEDDRPKRISLRNRGSGNESEGSAV